MISKVSEKSPEAGEKIGAGVAGISQIGVLFFAVLGQPAMFFNTTAGLADPNAIFTN